MAVTSLNSGVSNLGFKSIDQPTPTDGDQSNVTLNSTGTPPVSAGAATQVGPTPDPVMGALVGANAQILSTLQEFRDKSGKGTDSLVELSRQIVDLKKRMEGLSASKIEADQLAKSAMLKEMQHKFEEAAKKAEKAANDHKHGGALSWLKTAVEAVVAVVTMAIGAVLIATGVGAPLGVLMMAAGALTLYSAVDGAVSQSTGHGVVGHIAKAAGASDALTAKLEMGVGIAVAVIGLAMAAVMFFLPGAQGVAVAGAEAGVSAAMTAGNGLRAGQATQSTMSTVNMAARTAGNLANIAGQVVSTTAGLTAASFEFEASKSNASAARSRADGKQLNALMSELDKQIDLAMEMLRNTTTSFHNMMDNVSDALKDQGRSLSRARLSA